MIIDAALQQGWRLVNNTNRQNVYSLVPPIGHCATHWAAEYRTINYNNKYVYVPHWAAEFVTGKRCPRTGSNTNHGACPRGGISPSNTPFLGREFL
jgi:hypothetical protein